MKNATRDQNHNHKDMHSQDICWKFEETNSIHGDKIRSSEICLESAYHLVTLHSYPPPPLPPPPPPPPPFNMDLKTKGLGPNPNACWEFKKSGSGSSPGRLPSPHCACAAHRPEVGCPGNRWLGAPPGDCRGNNGKRRGMV